MTHEYERNLVETDKHTRVKQYSPFPSEKYIICVMCRITRLSIQMEFLFSTYFGNIKLIVSYLFCIRVHISNAKDEVYHSKRYEKNNDAKDKW